MVFNTSEYFFESNKERNLYYKIFAGYIFNEFISGIDMRVEGFVQFLSKPVFKSENHPNAKIDIKTDKSHISFDNYINLFDFGEKKPDRGEFADILIHCKETKTLISIEAKLNSDWDFDKDILSNQKRLEKILEKLPTGTNIYPFLLVTKNKWDQVNKSRSHPQSNLKKLIELNENSKIGKSKEATSIKLKSSYNIILWDDLIDNVIKNRVVIKYLKSKLENLDYNYVFGEDGFKKNQK